MKNNQLLGNIFILSGIATIYYSFFMQESKVGKPEYATQETPNILLNDDRIIFGDTTNSNTIKGYPMPDKINSLKPINDTIWVMTKPNMSAFGENEKSMFPVNVNFTQNSLHYKNNLGVFIVENFETVKNKIILPDKKYLK